MDVDEVSRYVDVRIEALARWLDDLSAAPVGIRTSSAAWQEHLRGFVDEHQRDGW